MKRILALLTALSVCLSLAAIVPTRMPSLDLPNDAVVDAYTVPDTQQDPETRNTQAKPMRDPPEHEGDWT